MLAESWFESESRLCASCRMFPVLCACAQARRRSTSRRRWSTFATSACRWWRRSSSLSWRWRRWPRKSTASSRLSRHLRRRHEGPAQYSRSYVYDMEGEPAMCEVSCVTGDLCVDFSGWPIIYIDGIFASFLLCKLKVHSKQRNCTVYPILVTVRCR